MTALTIDYLSFENQIEREWSGKLTGNEYLVVRFIFDRTIRWNKRSEFIYSRHFLEGVYSKSGDMIRCGLQLTENTLRKCIKRLKELGLLKTTTARNKRNGKIGYYFTLLFREDFEMLKQPKNKREKQSGLKQPKNTPAKIEGHNNKQNNASSLSKDNSEEGTYVRTQEVEEEDIHAELDLSVAESIKQAQNKNLEAVRKNKAEAKRLPTPWKMQKLWDKLVPEYHAGAVGHVWTGKAKGQMKSFFYQLDEKGINQAEFFEFIIARWETILNEKLRWQRGDQVVTTPSFPDFGFVCGFKNVFLNAYNFDQARYEEEDRMTFRERTLAQLVRQGYTQEQAEERYEEKYNLSKKNKDKSDALGYTVASLRKAEKKIKDLERENLKAKGDAKKRYQESKKQNEPRFKKPTKNYWDDPDHEIETDFGEFEDHE